MEVCKGCLRISVPLLADKPSIARNRHTVAVYDLLRIACECHTVGFVVYIQLFGLGSKVFSERFQYMSTNRPMIFGNIWVK